MGAHNRQNHDRIFISGNRKRAYHHDSVVDFVSGRTISLILHHDDGVLQVGPRTSTMITSTRIDNEHWNKLWNDHVVHGIVVWRQWCGEIVYCITQAISKLFILWSWLCLGKWPFNSASSKAQLSWCSATVKIKRKLSLPSIGRMIAYGGGPKPVYVSVNANLVHPCQWPDFHYPSPLLFLFVVCRIAGCWKGMPHHAPLILVSAVYRLLDWMK